MHRRDFLKFIAAALALIGLPIKAGSDERDGRVIVNKQPRSGNIFFVDGSKGPKGTNANNGLTPDNAVRTIAYAMSLCAADNNDHIFLVGAERT